MIYETRIGETESGFLANSFYGIVVSVKERQSLPGEFSLSQNYPNPFNPTTMIRYDLPRQSYVRIIIYDILGREVATLVNELQDAGYKSKQWSAEGVPSGVYFYSLQIANFSRMKKMILLK